MLKAKEQASQVQEHIWDAKYIRPIASWFFGCSALNCSDKSTFWYKKLLVVLCIPFVIWTPRIFSILFFQLFLEKRRRKTGEICSVCSILWQTNEILTIKPPPLCRYLSASTSQFAALLWFLRVYKRESNGVVNTACKKPSNFPSLWHKPVFLLFSANCVWGFCCVLKWMCKTTEGLLFYPSLGNDYVEFSIGT